MQRNNLPVLLLVIVMGVLALGTTAFMMLRPASGPTANAAAAAPTPTPAPVARYVAARDIPPRTVVNATMLRRDFQPGAVPLGAISSVDEVAGQLTSEPIVAGQTVMLSSFTPGVRRQVKANIPIPSGLRGVAIYVDPAQTAAGLVDVGDRVDVISTHRLTYDKGPRQFIVGATNFTTGRTVAENVLVLAVDDSISAPEPTPTPVPGAAPPSGAPTPIPPPPAPASGPARKRVLLAALPETAARLVAANDQGTLHITIRNPNDSDAGLVPEAREYPSRIYTAPPEKTAANSGGNAGGGGSNRGSGARTTFPDIGPMPTLPPPSPPAPRSDPAIPSPPMAITDPPPPVAPTSREITVIRGTEKTRVIVPLR
ncbi:MAG TPA: Flp pilus assembly protein CpaB [Abditibacterium sp.]|jgi:Flp pilus assembly protein CpaB